MSERQSVTVDLDKLRARMLAAPVTEEQIDLLFALIETLQQQAAKAETARKTWTEIGARSEADAGAIRMAARPAANLLFSLDQRGGLGQETHRVIKETLAALDSALHDYGAGAQQLLSELSAARAAIERLRHAWDGLVRCSDEFEPEDMSACTEYRDLLDAAFLAVLATQAKESED